MARIKNGIAGGFSGKLGSVVGLNWRGMNIIRTMPSPTKKKPSERQLIQRSKFVVVTKFLKPLRSVIDLYFGQEIESKTRYNLAISYMLINAVSVEDDKVNITYEKVLITKGILIGFQEIHFQKTIIGVCNLKWFDNSGIGNAKSTDFVNVILYCEELDEFVLHEEVINRDKFYLLFNLPVGWGSKALDVWVYLTNDSRSDVSTSLYLGKH